MKNIIIKLRLILLVGIVIVAASCDKDEKKAGLMVKTKPTSSLTAFSAMTGGIVVGTAPINERGICWGTNNSPTKEDAFFLDNDPVEGEFVSKISNLEPLTNYYVRAYAITTSGETIYGDALDFTTTSFEVEAESNSYMVNPNDVIVLPVSRANKTQLGAQIFSSDVLVAELLWMDNIDVVDNVFSYGSGAIGNLVVITGNVEGNAVVTVKVNNIIKWSWHIWVTKNAKK